MPSAGAHREPRVPPELPAIDAIREARRHIAGAATRTALRRFDIVGDEGPGSAAAPALPSEVFLKLENTQPIRSFKIRGAANAMAHASDAQLAGGVWTASAGNMAQGAAWCARARGVACRVVVPDHAPRAKLDAIAALGATVERVPFDAWWNAMLTHVHPGLAGLMIHPFADTNVMAGNGTIGLELAEDAPGLDAVLVPWGGGGLSLGIAAALRAVSPGTQVYAVEVETAAPLTASLIAGRPVSVQRTGTWIDGMGSDRVSGEMWPLVPGLIAGTVVVTVAQVAAALRLMAETADVVAEGAGAATVAAALGGRLHPAPEAGGAARGGAGRDAPARTALDGARVACIISGGNINREIVDRILNGEVP